MAGINNICNSRLLWQGKVLAGQVKGLVVDRDKAIENGKVDATGVSKYNEIVAKANELVNQLFYGTMLREFRDSHKPAMLDSGPGGTTFIRQLDMEIVKQMSKQGVQNVRSEGRVKVSNELVKALVKELSGDKYNSAVAG